MQGLLPRFRRRIDRNNWVPIGEGADSAPSTTQDGSIMTSARLEGPPNFGVPVEPQLSTPSISQLQALSRPETASLISRPDTQCDTLGSADCGTGLAARVVDLKDIQDDERQVSMNNRLSSVPSYPVFLDVRDPFRSRRRSSLASTNTAGILLSVGSLPGSEPFDKNVASANYAVERCTALEARAPVSPLLSPLSPFEASVAHVMTVHRVRSTSPAIGHCGQVVRN
jgi:hypothetical protein